MGQRRLDLGWLDPLQNEEFFGGPQDLSYVFAYWKALTELKARHRPGAAETAKREEEHFQSNEHGPKGKGRRHKRVEDAAGGTGK